MSERRERYAAAIEGVSLWRAADAAIAVADEETKRKHDTARAFMGPEDLAHESEGPKMFAAGWHAALDYLGENR